MTFELLRIMSLVSSDDITITFILGLVGNVMTTLIPMAVPISIFFSTIFCLSKLSGDSEYIALRAAGLEKIHILKPFLVVSIVVAISVYFLNQDLIPNAHRQVRKKIKIISSSSLIQGIKTGQFFTKIPNITLFPTEVDEVTKDLKDVFIHIYNNKSEVEKVIFAGAGKVLHEKNEQTGIESFKLLLNNGNIVNKSKNNVNLEKILFDEYVLPISEKRFSYQTSVKEIMMNKSELEEFTSYTFEEVKKKGFNKKVFFNAKYEYWNRLNTPFLCILLTFIGFGLGVTGNRGRGGNSSGKAILILIGYYIVYFGLVGMAKDGSIPVIISMIIPGGILLLLGARFYKKLDWVS
jgi:lipopolysaccharide export LptBFGC system permease protein LptF